MNRRSFIKSAAATLAAFPFIRTEAKTSPKAIDTSWTKTQYGSMDIVPERLWTPAEITEAGFVFVAFPTFIHQWNDPYNPIMSSYTSKSDDLQRPMIAKSRMVTPWFIKDYDIDSGTRRGIHNVRDYHYKKDIFKPMILAEMKRQEFHYVYEVRLGDSPCIWEDKYENAALLGTFYNYMFPVFFRGARLPKKI